jgi:glycosyltransferase involved in cell wall biosynthesis
VPAVTVLLATYQGERYLPAQLESLVAQQGVDWTLVWRDDGSTDGTVALLEDFAGRTGRARRLAVPAGRAGVFRSFMALLAAAETSELIAFCDQDDVWLPRKLARAAAAFAAVPSGVPAVYCSRQQLVDAALQPIGLSPLPQRPPDFANALVQNIATGCTMVMNAPARALMLSAPMPARTLHDWWCYLLVSGCGGTVLYDEEPSLLYRQHGGNLVGAPAGSLTRGWRAMKHGPRGFLDLLAHHLDALGAAPLTAKARARLRAMLGLASRSPWRRVSALRQAGVYRQTAKEMMVLYLWAALWRLQKAGSSGVRR